MHLYSIFISLRGHLWTLAHESQKVSVFFKWLLITIQVFFQNFRAPKDRQRWDKTQKGISKVKHFCTWSFSAEQKTHRSWSRDPPVQSTWSTVICARGSMILPILHALPIRVALPRLAGGPKIGQRHPYTNNLNLLQRWSTDRQSDREMEKKNGSFWHTQVLS